jgi:cytochrome c oxidase subunit 2
VHLVLRSQDVIHSFWAPNLNGKRDLIPGHETDLWIQVDDEAAFPGWCAEYCGLQHAHMRFVVIAEPSDRFQGWLATQRQPASLPATPAEERGKQVFLSAQCPFCHTIRGTGAGGETAPDLTHFASRTTIAAGTLPRTAGHLSGWILDPQALKPGSLMPPTSLPTEDVQVLVAYLLSLR